MLAFLACKSKSRSESELEASELESSSSSSSSALASTSSSSSKSSFLELYEGLQSEGVILAGQQAAWKLDGVL